MPVSPSDKRFIDTNVVLYLYSEDEPDKKALGERYRHSYFDSLILAAALECGCDTLASEDMQNGFIVESRLTIRNPFA